MQRFRQDLRKAPEATNDLGVQFAIAAPGTPGPQGITGTSGDDTLIGDNEVDDFLEGLGGNDILDGLRGNDTTDGGIGNDTHLVDAAGDKIIERDGEGYDIVISSSLNFTLTAGAYVEELRMTTELSLPGARLTGNALTQAIYGNNSDQILDGGGGGDTIYGLGGNDTLNGRPGDTLIGGDGSDTYYLSSSAITVVEAASAIASYDTIWVVGSYVLAAGNSIEELRAQFSGTQGFNLTGNEFSQLLTGDQLGNIMIGGGGTDTFFGYNGNDTYYVDSSDDVVREDGNQGNDIVITTVSYVLGQADSIETLRILDVSSTAALNLTGSDTANVIIGNDGNNIIDGRGGIDTMTGHKGDDTYYVNSSADVVIEAAGEGNDRIYSSAGNYTLAAGSEVETLSTTDNAGTGQTNYAGNEFGNTIYGNAGNNTLTGGGGDDRLYGWEGTNQLIGGTGDDWYYVGYGSDTIVELAGEGSGDRAFTGSDYTLAEGVYVEVLSTDWHEGTAAIALGGNNLENIIIGNDGNNILYGKGGFDTIYGNGGNDTFYVSDAGDFIVEYANDGSDRIYASVDYTLFDDGYVETLSTDYIAGTANISLGGNNLDNFIIGNEGQNTLYGKGGNDTLYGHGGADTFLFTSKGAGDIDLIGDFVSGTDRIALYSSVFTGLSSGGVPASAFVVGSAAGDGDDRLIYNQATGQLFYDADGTGATAAIQFATLTPGQTLLAGDFIVF